MALIWANAFEGSYQAFWETKTSFAPAWLHLDIALEDWAADGLLAIFFFVAGLEVKRELTVGELADRRAAALPVFAAVGGMVLPALVALAVSGGAAAVGGAWAIPVPTDIAFALGVLALVRASLPSGAVLCLLVTMVVFGLGFCWCGLDCPEVPKGESATGAAVSLVSSPSGSSSVRGAGLERSARPGLGPLRARPTHARSAAYRDPTLLLLVALVGSACELTPPDGAPTTKIVEVIDGDTVRIATSGGEEDTVRVIGIDTPETRRPGRGVECGGRAATAALRDLAEGRAARVIEDPTQDRRDRYQRRLAVLVLEDGTDLGGRQVADGHAEVYVFERPFRRLSRYRRAERKARARRDGAWGACDGDFHRPE